MSTRRVSGTHESAIFHNLALALIAEIAAALCRAGLARAEVRRGAWVVYFAYLGILMTACRNTVTKQTPIN